VVLVVSPCRPYFLLGSVAIVFFGGTIQQEIDRAAPLLLRDTLEG
jgi:hypothetical protein